MSTTIQYTQYNEASLLQRHFFPKLYNIQVSKEEKKKAKPRQIRIWTHMNTRLTISRERGT